MFNGLRWQHLVVLIAIVGLAGCLGVLVGSDEPEPEPAPLLESAFEDSNASPSVTGERVTSISDGHDSSEYTDVITSDGLGGFHSELIDGENLERPVGHEVGVTNESWWSLDPETNDSTVFELDSSENISILERDVESYDLEYVGTTMVANRTAHEITFDPKDEGVESGIGLQVGETNYMYPLETVEYPEAELLEGTVWVDAERAYPLALEETYRDVDGGTIEFTMEYDSISFDGTPDPTLFEPPSEEGSAVTEPETSVETFDSRAQAEEALSFSLPEFTLPDEFTTQEHSVDEWDGVQTYHESLDSEDGPVWLSISDSPIESSEPERTDVGAENVSVSTAGDATLINWECDGRYFELSSPLEEERLLELATDIDC